MERGRRGRRGAQGRASRERERVSRERERVSRAAAVAASSRVERAQLRERGCRGRGRRGGAAHPPCRRGRGCPGWRGVAQRGAVEGARRVLLLWRFCGAFVALLSAVEGSKRAAKGQRIERGARGRWGLSGGRREDGRGGGYRSRGRVLWRSFGPLLALILLSEKQYKCSDGLGFTHLRAPYSP